MKIRLHKLHLKDILSLICLIIIGFCWILIDQTLFPEVFQRFIAFTVITLTLYWLQFVINKPKRNQEMSYAYTIALITVSFVIVVNLIIHVFVNHDFTIKSILIWIILALLPYVAGFIYQITSNPL